MTIDPAILTALLPWADKILLLTVITFLFALARGQSAPTFPLAPPAATPPVTPPAVPPVVAPPVVAPPVVEPPVQPPVVVPPVVPPVVPTTPPIIVAPGIPRFTNITTTSFAGAKDTQKSKESGYTGKIIDSSKPGAALPYHFPGTPPVIRVFCRGKTVDCPIVDIGPWNTHDPYWDHPGARPQAETGKDTSGRVTNRAGLDITPGAWAALGKTGDLDLITDVTSWDFITVLDKGGGVPATPPTIPPAPASGGTVLQSNVWPTQADCPSFYGSPSVVASSLVKVTCPWTFTVEGTHSNQITTHKKCAASLERVLNYIWEQCGKDPAKIHEFGYDIFDGSYNPRNIAGTNTPSVHSYAAAMDWNAAANPQHAPLSQTKFKADSLIVFAFKAESWVWGGDWSPASIDVMHFQAARVR
jgi:hypothetical protein